MNNGTLVRTSTHPFSGLRYVCIQDLLSHYRLNLATLLQSKLDAKDSDFKNKLDGMIFSVKEIITSLESL
jgi:hypothetical protein